MQAEQAYHTLVLPSRNGHSSIAQLNLPPPFLSPFCGTLVLQLMLMKPVLLLLCGGAALLPATLFALMADGSPVRAVVGAVALAALGGGVSAVGAVATAEQFPGEGRLSGLALGATTATAIFGGVAPWAAQRLIGWTGSAVVPGVMIAVVALAALPVLALLPETRPQVRPAS